MMKIYLPVNKSPATGKGFFCQRLAEAIKHMGIELTSADQLHDVSLHLVKLAKTKSRKRVIRFNGVHHNTGLDYKSRNKVLRKNLHASDAVVYQSNFSKALCDRYLGKFRGPRVIIPNGADPLYFKQIKPIKRKYEHVFFTASRWRPHKRLPEIIKSFLLAGVENSCLYVAGNLKKAKIPKSHPMFAHKNVHYVGLLSQEQSAAYLNIADAFIHLCWFDNCPNGAVEAIAAGVPVITNNVGGTHEVVRPSNGIVCEIDSPYDLAPVKLYSPPKIDCSKIADAIKQCSLNKRQIEFSHIDIVNIAKRYVDFFREVS